MLDEPLQEMESSKIKGNVILALAEVEGGSIKGVTGGCVLDP